MSENLFTVLTNQVIAILTYYLPYLREDEAIAIAKIGKDAYKHGNELYAIVQKRLPQKYNQEMVDQIIEECIAGNGAFSHFLPQFLTETLQSKPDFAKELRQAISRTPSIIRNQDLQDYAGFLSKDSPWIWIITSLEGNGKTELLQQMEKKTPNITVVNLDFVGELNHINESTGKRDPISILKYLKLFTEKVQNECNPKAVENLFEKIQSTEERLKNKTDDFIYSLIDNIIAGEKINLVNNRSNLNTEIYRQELEKNARPLIKQAFFRLMESFGPDDLIIHLDTCEWLMEPVNNDFRQWFIADILLELYNNMHRKGKHLHVVMMSSIDLILPVSDKTYRHDPLKSLEEKAVTEYLKRIGIDEPELFEPFYKMTGGHAFCVKLLRELWQEWEEDGTPLPTRNNEGQLTSSIELFLFEFRKSFYVKVDKEFISKYVLTKFKKSHLEKPIRYAILLREFDFPQFKTVFSKLFKPESDPEDVFRQLTKRLYIIGKGPFTYAMHDLFRAALTQRILTEHPDDWKEYHEYAIRFWLDKTFNLVELLKSSDWYYHNLAFHLGKNDNEATGKRYWRETLESLRELGVIEFKPLVEAASDKTLMFFSGVASEVRNYEKSAS